MLNGKLQPWLYPKPTGDVGRDRNARTLQFACVLSSCAAVVIAVLDTVTGGHEALPILAMLTGLVTAAVINRAGKQEWASRIAILTVLSAATLLVFEAHDGFRSYAMLIFPGMLLISVMLLDRAFYLTLGAVVLLTVAGLGIAEMHGFTRAKPGVRTPTSYDSIFNVEVSLAIFTLIGSRIVGDVKSDICDLRGGIQQLSDANFELKKGVRVLQRKATIFTARGDIDYGLWMCAPDGRNIYGCAPFLKLTGKVLNGTADFKSVDLIHPEDRDRTLTAWNECIRSAGRWEIEYRSRGADGEWHPTLSQAAPVRNEQGQITCWAGIDLNITALKRIQESLRASENQAQVRTAELQAIKDAAPQVILVAHDSECRHISGNHTAHVLLRQQPGSNFSISSPAAEQPTTLRWMQYGVEIQPHETPLYRTARTGQPVQNWEVQAVLEDGTSIDLLGNVEPMVDDSGYPHGAVAVLTDITERKRAETERGKLWAQLAQAQKMESLGRLASGVAHDFNNLMSVIHMYADSALEEMKSGDPASESVKEIREATEKATSLGRQLMAFSSTQRLQTEILSLNSVIWDSHKLLRRVIGADVEVVFRPCAVSSRVKADRRQIGQMITNLALNSRDSMPEGGTLTIETARVELDQGDSRLPPGAKPGMYIRLVIRDTGLGMNSETRARAFEPLYPTKEVNNGAGLGLSVVYGIVRQSGGFIDVTSDPVQGTEFRIHLPAVQDTPKPILDTIEGPIRGGSETILLAEDQLELRQKLHRILEGAGYQVLAAQDGERAFQIALRKEQRIDLLLTDVVMPRTSGDRLSERLRTYFPDMKTLYMSGYPDIGDRKLSPELRTNYILKPFNKEKVLRRVREALDDDLPQDQNT